MSLASHALAVAHWRRVGRRSMRDTDEYEWWRMNAKRKVKIQNKYVNEAVGGNIVSVAGEEYESQIIAKI